MTTDYLIGSTVWTELEVREIDGIEEFYLNVLGWTLDLDDAAGDGYFLLDGQQIAGIRVRPDASEDELGWRAYLGAENLDAAIDRAVNAGAVVDTSRSLLIEGTAAVLVDPFGAKFGLAELPQGAAVPQSTTLGNLVLVDPTNHDLTTQIEFQDALFPGNELDRLDSGINIFRDEVGNALRGAYEVAEDARAFLPPHWLPWFSVADQKVATDLALTNGGRVNTVDNELSFGVWGVVVDPQGGEFKVLEMNRSTL
ncbi:MAG: VOC family protein [Gulosibacter sp.]|uniref:VOC family protein n=1 Tax=Gulosibacter sp. TaxID=2817531 RepID=UPI003F92631C